MSPVGHRTHELPHTVASNMVKVFHALNHSATGAGGLCESHNIIWKVAYFWVCLRAHGLKTNQCRPYSSASYRVLEYVLRKKTNYNVWQM